MLSLRIAYRHVICLFAWVIFITVAGGGTFALEPGKPLTQYALDSWQDELPQNTINAIAQTPDGYIWLGTYEGLVRFDGVQFTIFDKRNTNELKSNAIFSLFEDREKNLWIGTLSGGLNRYK